MRYLQCFNSSSETVFAINLFHKNGGYETVLGETKQESIRSAERLAEKYPDDYIATTIPYYAFMKQRAKGHKSSVYDISIPANIKKSIGMQLRISSDLQNIISGKTNYEDTVL